MKGAKASTRGAFGKIVLVLLFSLVLVISLAPLSNAGVSIVELRDAHPPLHSGEGESEGLPFDNDDFMAEDSTGMLVDTTGGLTDAAEPFFGSPEAEVTATGQDDVLAQPLGGLLDDPVGDTYADPLITAEGHVMGQAFAAEHVGPSVTFLSPQAGSTAAYPTANIKLTGMQRYDFAYQVLKIINQERAMYGLGALSMNATLMDNAMQRSAETAVFFNHTRPNGQACDTVSNTTLSAKWFGENIAAGYTTAESVMKDWMISTGHRSNIIKAEYKSVGIGCFSHEGRLYWTQLFMDTASTTPTQPMNSTITRTVAINGGTCAFGSVTLLSDAIVNVGEKKSCRLMIANASPNASFATFIPDSNYGITWSSSNAACLQVLPTGQMSGIGAGSATLKGQLTGFITASKAVSIFTGSEASTPPAPPTPPTPPAPPAPTTPTGKLMLSYSTHVQSIGWQKAASDGAMSGTIGKGYRIEGLKVNLVNDTGYAGGIKYATHIQSIGWQAPASVTTTGSSTLASQGALSGTTSRGLRLEAITMELTGTLAKHYDIYYRVHAQSVGWMGWAKNGQQAGTAGYGLRLEALQVCLKPKGSAMPSNTYKSMTAASGAPRLIDAAAASSGLRYSAIAHVQSVGNKVYPSANGSTQLGSLGRGLRLEALTLSLPSPPYAGGLRYETHIQRIGWQEAKVGGQMSGTYGKGLRIEAIRLSLTGEMSKHYDVYYRSHVQGFGWSGWAKNGQSCGSSGYGYRMEALQVVILPKGVAPGPNAGYFYKR